MKLEVSAGRVLLNKEDKDKKEGEKEEEEEEKEEEEETEEKGDEGVIFRTLLCNLTITSSSKR